MIHANSVHLRTLLTDGGFIDLSKQEAFSIDDGEFAHQLGVLANQHPNLAMEQRRDRAAYRCLTRKVQHVITASQLDSMVAALSDHTAQLKAANDLLVLISRNTRPWYTRLMDWFRGR